MILNADCFRHQIRPKSHRHLLIVHSGSVVQGCEFGGRALGSPVSTASRETLPERAAVYTAARAAFLGQCSALSSVSGWGYDVRSGGKGCRGRRVMKPGFLNRRERVSLRTCPLGSASCVHVKTPTPQNEKCGRGRHGAVVAGSVSGTTSPRRHSSADSHFPVTPSEGPQGLAQVCPFSPVTPSCERVASRSVGAGGGAGSTTQGPLAEGAHHIRLHHWQKHVARPPWGRGWLCPLCVQERTGPAVGGRTWPHDRRLTAHSTQMGCLPGLRV